MVLIKVRPSKMEETGEFKFGSSSEGALQRVTLHCPVRYWKKEGGCLFRHKKSKSPLYVVKDLYTCPTSSNNSCFIDVVELHLDANQTVGDGLKPARRARPPRVFFLAILSNNEFTFVFQITRTWV